MVILFYIIYVLMPLKHVPVYIYMYIHIYVILYVISIKYGYLHAFIKLRYY